MVRVKDEEIKGLVRDHYAEVARSAASCDESSCCSPKVELYSADETEGLPAQAVTASAGCGNPTAMASLRPGETVVDFGSGGGIDCFLAAKEVGPEGRVIGVDMTPDMVDLARSNALKLELSNVEFHLTEMEHTPIEDNTADVIISNCVINLAPGKLAVFQEAFRILRPGGRLYVSDIVLEEALPADVAADASQWAGCIAGAEVKETYLGKMATAGFVDADVLSESALDASGGWKSKVLSVNVRALKPA
jgi:SAM-dependent methyltransferase